MAKPTRKTGFKERGQAGYQAALGSDKTILRDRVKLGDGGRLVIPAAMREALGIRPGDDIALECVDGELKVQSYLAVVKEIQARVKALVPPEVNVVDGFIAERLEEQRNSDERFERLHREGMALRSDDT